MQHSLTDDAGNHKSPRTIYFEQVAFVYILVFIITGLYFFNQGLAVKSLNVFYFQVFGLSALFGFMIYMLSDGANFWITSITSLLLIIGFGWFLFDKTPDDSLVVSFFDDILKLSLGSIFFILLGSGFGMYLRSSNRKNVKIWFSFKPPVDLYFKVSGRLKSAEGIYKGVLQMLTYAGVLFSFYQAIKKYLL